MGTEMDQGKPLLDGDDFTARSPDLCASNNPGKQKKSKKRMLEQKKSQSLDESRARQASNPPLYRSKTVDPSFYKDRERDAVPGSHRNTESSLSNLRKHAINFHRVFQDLPSEEELLETFSCAWQQELSYHGRLYISHHHVCFYCSMIRREVKVTIPVATISVLKKANTALLVPNAICIRTSEGEKFVFGSLRSRESVYQLLRSVCKHLQDGSRNSRLTPPDAGSENLKASPDPSANSHWTECDAVHEEADGDGEPEIGARCADGVTNGQRQRGATGSKALGELDGALRTRQRHRPDLPHLGGRVDRFLGLHWPAHRPAGGAADVHGSLARFSPPASVQGHLRTREKAERPISSL
ncbi:hypothetical protein JRQ81_008893 [Phrynocephalus forsythii]|uniref:GRAM domain-containing protein n=1 Tax=Phrynocephalus forsythii TaxID=171643 RepID=A0A9Q0XAV1_9SAUR|nr:hypothetical protein JRQ81_008893 [Phrynocephalus forsythii]